MQDAESQWEALASSYTSDQQLIRELWKELSQNYSQSGRYYHNLHHIEALLQLAEEHKASIQQFDLLRFAVFYHDIIYSTTRSDNEARSAALAAERLQELHLTDEKIRIVQEMILATKSHQPHQSEDVNFMLDIDLSVLGADSNKYDQYRKQIRQEYNLYPDLLYNRGRKKVLQHFLSQPAIYKTATFQNSLEAQARQNLQREVNSL
ncbi:hypothetical protein DXT99_23055 [Pontibacter diazotrophicus]|uniref:HD domain-containing protein n=1 Tax=Pontibacter diazotrophicus TaxID=1400979 RepID=A0A3D8L3L0_9BACT|nr:hypothetical protein [Pontibacter diazotrophicus]RDV12011.1 hypothetical protein DXT99_23055 [Pontibacter diazotrophicus]